MPTRGKRSRAPPVPRPPAAAHAPAPTWVLLTKRTNRTQNTLSFSSADPASADAAETGSGTAPRATASAARPGVVAAAAPATAAAAAAGESESAVPGEGALTCVQQRIVWPRSLPAHPATKLDRGRFTVDHMPLDVPAALRRAVDGVRALPSAPLLARGWTWVPPTLLSPEAWEALRNAATVTPRQFKPAGNVPAWKRRAAAATKTVQDVLHGEGAMPEVPRTAWAPGALPMYRNITAARDTGGAWLPRGLAAELFPSAPVVDHTCNGLPLRPHAPPAVAFLPHLPQQQAHDAVLRHWGGAPVGRASCFLLMPCGYGKSITALLTARTAGRRMLWVVTRRTLAEDAARVVQRVFPGTVRVRKAPAKRAGLAPAPPETPLSTASTKAGGGAPVPFSVAVLDGQAQHVHPATCGADVLIVSVHTLLSRCEEYPRAAWSAYGTMIVDEAHMMSHRFLHALAVIPARRVLALSATPYRADGTTRGLYWAFGPLVFACRRPAMTLMGEVWVWGGGPRTLKYQGSTIDTASTLTTLCDKDVERFDTVVAAVRAAVRQGRCVLAMGDRVAFLQRVAGAVRAGEPTRDVFIPHALSAADARRDFTADGIVLKADGVWVGAAVCIHKDTPVWLRQCVLGRAACVCAHPSIAKVGLSCSALDTVVMTTPLSDPEQIVGRITRADSIGRVPLVIDIVDPYDPFLSGWRSRQRAYAFLDMDICTRSMQQAVTLQLAEECLAPYDRRLSVSTGTNGESSA